MRTKARLPTVALLLRIGGHGLDVASLSDCNVRVAKDRLDRLVIHAQPMKVGRKVAPE